VDNMVARHGYSAERISRRMQVVTALPASVQEWRAEGIRYLVVGPDETSLKAHTESWLQSGEASVSASFGPLVIIDIDREQ
jgi:hypothetical protein